MEKYLEILKENTKYNLPVPLIVSIVLLCLSPLILGVENLEQADTAKVLEMYVALLGIVLLPPIFLPEQNQDLRDLIRSKYTRIEWIYVVRVLEAALVFAILLGIYMLRLWQNGCEMQVIPFYGGILAEMLFMGGLGILCYSLTDNLIAGYLVPIFYYIMAIGAGAKYLKVFYPFSISQGSYREKFWLFGGGIIMTVMGIRLRDRRRRAGRKK